MTRDEFCYQYAQPVMVPESRMRRDLDALIAEEVAKAAKESEWEQKASSLARQFAPRIYPCADCGEPFVNGYCCTFCGSRNPEGVR